MKNENIVSIEETETNPSPSPSAASAPLREPDPPTQNPGAGSDSKPFLTSETSDSCPLSARERDGVRGNSASELTNGSSTERSSNPQSDRKSTGKVAHLPKDVRRTVNEMLDDGATYNEIVAKLAELGHPGFFYQNIQRWKNGGYQHWLRAQEQREETIIMTETALELAQDDPNTAAHLCEANEILLALKNHKLLQEINDWDAETLLGTEKSKAYFQLSRSITQQLAQRTRRERFKFDVEWKKQKQEVAKQVEQKNGITPMTKEQRAYILDQMDEILGLKLDPADFEDDHDSKTTGDQAAVGNEVSSLRLRRNQILHSALPTPHFPSHTATHANTRRRSTLNLKLLTVPARKDTRTHANTRPCRSLTSPRNPWAPNGPT